jgi:hypothetical protein
MKSHKEMTPMKRSIQFVFALVLLLSLCAALTPALALSDPEALVIQSITVTADGDIVVLQTSLNNAGSEPIDKFALALAFLDESGYQLFGYADTLDGYADEVCNWYYEPNTAIASGGTYYTRDEFSNYQGTTQIAVAIRYYHIQDGDYILIPESQWQWIYPGAEDQSGTLNRDFYTSPPNYLYDVIGDYEPGYHYSLLDDYNAYYYGKSEGGEWITAVTPGSPADNAGLLPGDLLLTVDRVKLTENRYGVEYAMAKIMSGETVDWVYERDGVTYVARLGKE